MGAQCPDHPRNWHKQEKRGSRHERGYGNDWTRLRERMLLRDKGLCQPCNHQGRVSQATEVDHIVPKTQGGTDDPTNLQSICSACHKIKTALESTGERASFQPEWLPEPRIPVVLIFGPPGSGKTTLAHQMARGELLPLPQTSAPTSNYTPPETTQPPNAQVHALANAQSGTIVIDLDEIAAKQTGLPMHHAGKEARVNAVRARNFLIASLASPSCTWDKAIITMTGTGTDTRKWWTDKLKAQAIVMQTPKDLCIARIHARDIPVTRRLEQVHLVQSWR